MEDIADKIAKLRADATECEALADTSEPDKRAFFWRLAEHLRDIANQMEQAMAFDDDRHDDPSRH